MTSTATSASLHSSACTSIPMSVTLGSDTTTRNEGGTVQAAARSSSYSSSNPMRSRIVPRRILRSRDGTAEGAGNSASDGVSAPDVNPKHAWMTGGLVVLLVVAAFVLGSRDRYQQRVVFPPNASVTRLAIRAPLVRPDLSVMATLRTSKRVTPVWMTVDSGATGITLPSDTYYALGIDALRGVTVRMEDPSGRVLVRDAGLVPQMTLGELQLEDVVTAIGGTPVLGQSVLAHAPWEIDWDRGVLTLGSTPWPAGGDTVIVPTRRAPTGGGDAEVVTIHVGSAPIDMVIDTGAFASLIPESVGASAGLSWRSVPPTVLRSLGGELIVRRVFSGDVRVGSFGFGKHELAAVKTGGRRASLGLLGLDILSHWQVQIVPGSHLALRPRGDVRAFTAERIARWSFLPTSCEHRACVHATLAPMGSDARLTATLDADLDQPIEVLLGCAGDRTDSFVPTGSSFAFGPAPDVARHVRLRIPGRARGTTSQTTIPNGAAWFHGAGAECAVLEALDVSPVSAIPVISPATGPVAPDPRNNEEELQASFWP